VSQPRDDSSGMSAKDKRALLAEKLKERARAATLELPLSRGQEALWLIHQLTPESPAYHVIFAAEIESPVDAEALRGSFQTLVDRHLALRSRFPSRDGKPFTIIDKSRKVPFELINASAWTRSETLEAIRKETERPFDLENGPILRVRLYERRPEEFYLAATFHHIAMDGWSLWICLSEIRELYGARIADREPVLPPIEHDFRYYLRRQKELLSSDEGGRLRTFWLETLEGHVEPLALPHPKKRAREQRRLGESHRFELRPESTAALKSLLQAEGATLQMALATLFQMLLARYADQQEFFIGTLSSGRSRTELENIVGYLANPLVLRAHIEEDATFRKLLRDARSTMLDAFDHQDYPFPMLVDELAPGRSESHSPLFQVLFVFEKAQQLEEEGISSFILGREGSTMALGDLSLKALPFTAQHEGQFDLILLFAEVDGAISGYFDYDVDLFDATTIQRFAGHFQQLVDSATRAPDVEVSGLELLTAAEKHALGEWNDTRADEPWIGFPQRFEAHVERDPDAIAVVVNGETALSYGELNRRSNQLAHHLIDQGVRTDTIVGLSLERSVDLIVGMLGILKSGGSFLPLDASYPRERVDFMMKDSGIALLVTSETLLPKLPEFSGTIIRVDADGERIGERAVHDPGPARTEDLAYIIYTSGSTGQPKGVMVDHRGLSMLSLEQQRHFGVGPGWRCLQFASISFDAAVFDTVMALASGGSLHLGSSDTLLPGEPLLAKLRDEAINIVTLPPSALMNVPTASLPDLRVITVAGEACPSELVERWAPGRRFFNLYGPTESTIWATFEACEASDATPGIGTPIRNTQAYVLDSNQRPVPVGIPGELYLGGSALARGYLDRPELTAERFLEDPFSSEPSARMYRTGDRVKRREDGALDYLGRLDFQVKIRGFRIELGEVEAVVLEHDGVTETIVVAPEEELSGRRLVCYVIAHQDGLDTTALREHLQNRLPEYMVPSAFVVLEGWPITANGKIDRNALPRPSRELPGDAPRASPTGDTEEKIAAVWCEVLDIEDVGVDDNFFEIGGNSLLLARVNAKLKETVDPNVAVLDMFKHPTIKTLAAHLEGESAAPSTATEEDHARALTAGQQRLREQRARRRGRKKKTP